MNSIRKALVVLSGGQDSTTCLAIYDRLRASGDLDELHAVTFDYGQRHRREIDAAYQIGKLARVDSHEVVEVGPILKGTSPLTNGAEQLETYSDHDSMAAIIGDRVEKTFVPMRNALFLTLAANRAVVLGCKEIVTGVCQEDNANYPDCRLEFISAQETAINEALGLESNPRRRIQISTPVIAITKAEAIGKLYGMGMDYFSWLAFSHTAYDGNYPPVGKDHASILRAHSFEEADRPDPLVVRAFSEGLMPLPMTGNYKHQISTIEAIQAGIAQHKAALALPGAQA